MAPGARSKFGAPIFEPEVFRKQMCCSEVLVTLLGLFGAPQSFDAWGIVPLPPVVTPVITARSDVPQQNQSWYTALIRGMLEPWASGGEIFSQPEFLLHFKENE